MDTPTITLRPLTIDDLEALIRIHRQSFPTSRTTKLGPVFLRKMYRWFLCYQPKLAIGACLNGELVGFVVGSLGGTSRIRFRYTLLEIIWGFLSQPWLLFQPEMFELWQSYAAGLLPARRRPAPVLQPAPIRPKLALKAGLDSIAVSGLARGLNIGTRLVMAFEAAAWKQGATLLSLGVDSDNTAARKLYESCGWQVRMEDPAHNFVNYVKT